MESQMTEGDLAVLAVRIKHPKEGKYSNKFLYNQKEIRSNMLQEVGGVHSSNDNKPMNSGNRKEEKTYLAKELWFIEYKVLVKYR